MFVRALTARCLSFSLQYMFDITKEEDEALISLQQRDMKSQRRIGRGENLSIGFGVFRVRPHSQFKTLYQVDINQEMLNKLITQ